MSESFVFVQWCVQLWATKRWMMGSVDLSIVTKLLRVIGVFWHVFYCIAIVWKYSSGYHSLVLITALPFLFEMLPPASWGYIYNFHYIQINSISNILFSCYFIQTLHWVDLNIITLSILNIDKTIIMWLNITFELWWSASALLNMVFLAICI